MADGAEFKLELMRLVWSRLDINQLTSLGKMVQKRCGDDPAAFSLTLLRLGLASNATFDLIVPALVASAARYGIFLEVVTTDFDQVVQEALQPGSTMNTVPLDAILIALDPRGLPIGFDAGETADSTVGEVLRYGATIKKGFKQNRSIPLIWQNLPLPPESLFGHYDRRCRRTAVYQIEEFNRALFAEILDESDLLLDINALAAAVGKDIWWNATAWNLGKLPFGQQMVPLYADSVARLLGAMKGKSRKCLVLDLDNTLWGGVIGDDGMDGIVLGEGEGTGEAYVRFQQVALDLKKRGVILAVCSKNEESTAREVFGKHSDMVLREGDIALFVANWQDKASNQSPRPLISAWTRWCSSMTTRWSGLRCAGRCRRWRSSSCRTIQPITGARCWRQDCLKPQV